jgi:hypothetical protein
MGFLRNVRLEITAPNLVVRKLDHRALHGQCWSTPWTARPGRADRLVQLGPARRPLVHGERLAQAEVLEGALPVAAAEESAEKETVSASELKDQPQRLVRGRDFGKGQQPLLRSRPGLSAGPSRRAGAISLRFPGWRCRRGPRCLLGSTPTCEILGRLKGTVLRNRFLLCRRGRLEGRAGAVRLSLRCSAGFGLRVPILGAIHDPDLLGRPRPGGRQPGCRRSNGHSVCTNVVSAYVRSPEHEIGTQPPAENVPRRGRGTASPSVAGEVGSGPFAKSVPESHGDYSCACDAIDPQRDR